MTSHRRVSRRAARNWQCAGVGAIVLTLFTSFALTLGNASGASQGYLTVYLPNAKPVAAAEDDPHSVSLGVRFTVSKPGTIVGVRYYKSAMNVGKHTGSLWTASGTRLATATFVTESASGWQSVRFAKPVSVVAKTKYIASYYTPSGYYAQQQWAFSDGRSIGNKSIRADRGVFSYGSDGFPSDTWHDSAYFVDVMFAPTASGRTTSRSASSTPSHSSTSAPSTSHPSTVTSSASTRASSGAASSTSTAPAPHAGSFPDANSTGWRHTGTTLTPYTGPSTITKDGTTIVGKDVNTCLNVQANNVTIENSRIRCAGSGPHDSGNMIIQQGTAYKSYSGLTLTDDEITRPTGSNGGADYAVLLYGTGVTITRVNIYNVTSGVHFSGRGVTIKDSYLHDFVNISGVDHIDGVIANGGAADVTLEHNTITIPGSQVTPIAIFPEGTPNTNWVIDSNLIAGGGYCIYPSYSKGSEQPNNHITVTNNQFSRMFFPNCGDGGPVDSGPNGAKFSDGVGNVWSGNIWADTGLPVTAR